jgi:hypothetical protein
LLKEIIRNLIIVKIIKPALVAFYKILKSNT